MQEIKQLKASLPHAEKLAQLKPEADSLYEAKKAIREKLNGLTENIEGKDKEIEAIKKEMDEAKEKRADIKDQLDKYEEDI